MALAAACALALVAGAQPAAAATVPAPTTSRIGLYCPCWAGPPRTSAAWDAAARNDSVIIGSTSLRSRLRHLHAVNPRLVALAYNLGPYVATGSPLYRQLLAQHPDYFARDANGELIHVIPFPGIVLMDLGNPGWRAQQARMTVGTASGGFDGAYVDSMGPAAVLGLYTTAAPINRATGQPYTETEWLEASKADLNAIKAALGRKFLLYNGLAGGTSYEFTRILASSDADGGQAEAFVRFAKDPVDLYPTPEDWLTNLRMEIDVQARGQAFFAWTKLWPDDVVTTPAQRTAWNTFALATYLLGKGDRSYYNYLPQRGVDRSTVFDPVEQARLGRPLAPYTVDANGVYHRRFANGTVTVDPVAHTASIVVGR